MTLKISPLSFAHFHSSTTLSNATMVEEFSSNMQIVLLWQGRFLWHMIVAVHLQTARGFLTYSNNGKGRSNECRVGCWQDRDRKLIQIRPQKRPRNGGAGSTRLHSNQLVWCSGLRRIEIDSGYPPTISPNKPFVLREQGYPIVTSFDMNPEATV